MQGQRGAVGSFAETLDFDHGTASNNTAVDQHSYWNHMRNPAENRTPDYMLSQSDMNIAVMNSTSHELPNLNRWCLGEPSSSNTQDEVSGNERKAEFGWSSSVSPCAMPGPRSEERHYELNSNLSVDNNVSPMFTQGSNSDVITQNLNLNAGIVGHSGNTSQAMECPNTYKIIGSENEQIRPASASDSFLLPEGSAGPSVGENDGRPSSLEGRRLSRKRKAIEGNAGQSSVGGSSSYLWHAENSPRPGISSRYNASSSLGTSASLEEANPRLGLGGREVISDCLPDSSVAGSSQRSHRNFRVRINTSNQHNSIPPPVFPSMRTVRHASVLSSQVSPHPVDPAFDLRPIVNNMNFQSQPVLIHAPSLPHNVQSLRWSGGSTSRAGSSSTSGVYGDRDALSEELGSRALARNMLDHPIFVPATEVGNAVPHPLSRGLNSRNSSVAGNVASTSRTGSGSAVHPPTASTWLSHHNSPQQHQRRLTEIVRRSLLSSTGTDSGGPGSNYQPPRVGHPSSSQEMVFTSGAGNRGHHQSHPRSASWLERHNDGMHYSLRGLAAANEGNNRLVSEIRNVLGLMRRGENLRFEDVMLLDQSVFFGVADMHDRHRDMRLDVDNMSYEELLALEERIGNVSTGLSEETIISGLKHKKLLVPVGSQCEAEPCCICQEEYNEGEDLGTLQCGHDFHSKCIKQWLMHKNLCPICKTTALAT